MTAEKPQRNTQGLIIPAADWRPEFLTPVGSALESSSYTETGPRPGQVEPDQENTRLVLEASGEQGVAFDLEVNRPGLPGAGRDGAGIGYRLATESTIHDWRTLRDPMWLNGWIAAEWSNSTAWPVFDLCVLPVSGRVILVRAADSSDFVRARVYDYDSHTWGAAVSVPDEFVYGGTNTTWAAVAVVALPDDSAIAIGIAPTSHDIYTWRSSDRGASWRPHAVPTRATGPNSTDRARAGYSREALLLVEQDTAISGTIRQHASSTLGVSFELIEDAAGIGTGIQLSAIPSGGFILAYINSALQACVRLLGTAYTPISEQPEIIIDATRTVEDIAIVVADNGVAWVFGRRNNSGGLPQQVWDRVQVWRSDDGGNTWATAIVGAAVDDVTAFSSGVGLNVYIENFAAVAARGDVIMCHNFVNSHPTDGLFGGSIGTAFFGGWSATLAGSQATSAGASVFGYGDFDEDLAECGIPLAIASDLGRWGQITTGGAVALVDGEHEITTATNTFLFHATALGAAAGAGQVFHIEGRIETGTGSSTTTEVGAELETGDGVTSFFLAIRFDAANGRVRFVDVGSGSTLFDVTHDVSTFFEVVASVQNSAVCRISYRTGRSSGWTHRIEALTDNGAATNEIRFGNLAAGTNTSRWRQWHYGARAAGITTGLSHLGSGPISNSPIGIRNTGTADGPTRLAAIRGPGFLEDAFSCSPAYEYGIAKIFPTSAPSPATPWRSTDKSEQLIVMDLGAQGMLGPVWGAALFLAGCNFRTAELESSDSGAAWTSRGTWDAAEGFAALEYERNGDWIRPDTAGVGVTPGRMLDANEIAAADGYAVLDGTHPVAVSQNGAGRWDSTAWAGMKPNARVRLVGGEGSSGSVDLVIPRGVLLYTFPGAVPTAFPRFWRIRIPASQVTPASYYQIGTALLGSIRIYGKRTSAGASHERAPNVRRTRSRRGTIRQRSDGPVARQWSISWADGVALGKVRGSDPDYVTGGAAQPRGVAGDVPGLLHGLIEEVVGGQVPIVAVSEGAGSRMITDRSLYLYGLIASPVQSNLVSGDDGSNEFVRVDTITIDEQL